MLKETSTISVVVPTYNSEKTLKRCLELVRSQNYPQEKIEILLGDGGSTDGTFAIAKKYKSKVIHIPHDKQNAEYNRGVAYNQAKGEFVLILDHDNFMPTNDWLREMIDPLLENSDMVATSTCFYHYSRRYSLMDRYFALFGTSEPLPYYLHKADRMPQGMKKWTLEGKAKDCGSYYLVTFGKDPRKFPSIGTNGCLMRRKIVNKYANTKPEYHYPIDILFEVVKSGHNQFGFVKNSIIHLTHSRGLLEFMKRKRWFVEHYYFNDISKRRWSVVMPGDEKNVALFILYSLTIIKPLWDSIYGFMRIPDVAWFINPIMCLGTTFIYGYVTLKYKLNNLFK